MSRVKICPKCGAIAEWDSYFGGTRCTRCDFVEKPKPSNGDRIRAMSDEELAEMLTPMFSCNQCPLSMAEREPCGTDGRRCLDRVLEWLKKEADNG